jgi:hypothetical protein
VTKDELVAILLLVKQRLIGSFFSPETRKLDGKIDSRKPKRHYRLQSSLHSYIYTLLECKYNLNIKYALNDINPCFDSIVGS